MSTRIKKILKASLTLIFALVMLFGFVQINVIADGYQPAQVSTIRLTVTPHVNEMVYDGSMTMTLIPKDVRGNLQWDGAITIPDTNTIEVPRNVDYLFRIEPKNENYFMVPASFANLTWSGSTKNSDETHWVYEYNFTASSVPGFVSQLTYTISFFDRFFDLQVNKVFSGVDPADIWIGVLDSYDANAAIAWEQLKVGDNFVEFSGLTRFDESPSEIDGRWPATRMPRSFQIYEYAPNYMQPEGNWNANPSLGGIQLPNNASIPRYALHLRPRGVTLETIAPTITNIDSPIVINSHADLLGEVSMNAIGGTKVMWTANKVADSVEVDLRAAGQKNSEFCVDYTVTFSAASELVQIDEPIIAIRGVAISVTYSGNVALGNNYIFGDFYLSRGGTSLGSASAIGGDHNTNSHLRIFNDTDDATDACIKHLRMSTSIITPLVDALHQLEFVGYFIYNRAGDPMQRSELPEILPEDGEIGNSGTFVRRVSRTLNIPIDRNDFDIDGLSDSYNDSEVDIEDSITVPELARILKINDLTVNDTDGIGGFTIAEDKRSATISIPGQMPKRIGGNDVIVVRYTVTYEDNSQKDRTSGGYTINNVATALGVDSGTSYSANAEVEVLTTPEFYVVYTPDSQDTWKVEDNPPTEVVFPEYEDAATSLPSFELTDSPGNLGSDTLPPPVTATVEDEDDDGNNDGTTEAGEPESLLMPEPPPDMEQSESPPMPEPPPDPEQPESPPMPEPPPAYEIINEEETPTMRHSANNSWALWNLILSIAGATLAFLMGIRALIRKRQKNKEYEQQYETVYAINKDEEQEGKKRGRLILIHEVPLLAIVGFATFMITQDMRLTMVLIDWWTLAHAILLTGGVFSYIFACKKKKDQDNSLDNDVETITTHTFTTVTTQTIKTG